MVLKGFWHEYLKIILLLNILFFMNRVSSLRVWWWGRRVVLRLMDRIPIATYTYDLGRRRFIYSLPVGKRLNTSTLIATAWLTKAFTRSLDETHAHQWAV